MHSHPLPTTSSTYPALELTTPRQGGTTLWIALAVMVTTAAGVAAVAGAPAAAAHDRLVGSLPLPDEELASAPASITLNFSEEPLALGAQVRVSAPDGSVISEGAAQADGTSVTQPLSAARPSGDYTVAWRVTSTDGHPIEGSYVFTVAPASDPAQSTTPSSPATPADPGAANPAPAATPGASSDAAGVDAAGADSEVLTAGQAPAEVSSAVSTNLYLWGPLVLAAGGIAIIVLRTRSRRRGK